MRKFLPLCGLTLFFTASALAAAKWNGAGWYQVSDMVMVGNQIERGPYESKDLCLATLPENQKDIDYSCMYLSERPDWDE